MGNIYYLKTTHVNVSFVDLLYISIFFFSLFLLLRGGFSMSELLGGSQVSDTAIHLRFLPFVFSIFSLGDTVVLLGMDLEVHR